MVVDFGISWQGVINFISSNLIAVITIILTIIGIFGTPYYVRTRISSARQERYNQAKESLLGFLENYMINDRDITEVRMNNLVSAVEHRYSVSISDRISMVELLQNLQLRIEESKLDVEDKEDYSNRIEEMIGAYREERHVDDLPSEYQVVIEELETAEDISAQSIVEELENVRRQRRVQPNQSFISMFHDVIKIMSRPALIFELPPSARKQVVRAFMLVVIFYVLLIFFFITGQLP